MEMGREPRERGDRREKGKESKRVEMKFADAPVPHNECIYSVLQTFTNKRRRKDRRANEMRLRLRRAVPLNVTGGMCVRRALRGSGLLGSLEESRSCSPRPGPQPEHGRKRQGNTAAAGVESGEPGAQEVGAAGASIPRGFLGDGALALGHFRE